MAESAQVTSELKGKTTRESNLELYRIIAMLHIVASHYVSGSGLTELIFISQTSWQSMFLFLFSAWGKTGINCFVLITGYFMCEKKITVKKFAKLLLELMFYRIVIQSVFWISGYALFSFKGLLQLLLPIRTIADGFTSTYLVFFLFIPFLTLLVHSMTERQHVLLLLLCGFTYVFFGTMPFFHVTMNYVSWFSVLFLLSSYVRLYPKEIWQNKKLWAGCTAISVALAALSVISGAWVGEKLNKRIVYHFVSDSNAFLAVAIGFCTFLLFKNLKIKYNKYINTVAASTFGVLCIHANSDTMRQWLWRDTLHNVDMYGSPWMPLHAFGSVIGVFVACVLIDQIRIRLIETPFFLWWDKHMEPFVVKCGKDIAKLLPE